VPDYEIRTVGDMRAVPAPEQPLMLMALHKWLRDPAAPAVFVWRPAQFRLDPDAMSIVKIE
jgi:hypothetical protein